MPWSMNARPSASDRAASSEASDGASSAKMPLYGPRTLPWASNISSNALE